MSRTGKYFDDLSSAFGANSVTSGFRSQEEQDGLVKQGATRATRSAHTYNNGYDFKPSLFKTEAEVRANLKAKGFEVDKVLYERGGKNQGTGPHWHTEGMRRVGSQQPRNPNGQALNSGSSGQGVAAPTAYLDGLESALAPATASSGNIRSNAGRIFGSDQKIEAAQQHVETQIDRSSQQIDVLDQVTQVAQAAQVSAATKQIDETRAVSNAITSGTQELQKKLEPVIEVREAVADQLDKVSNMNPLERSIRGIFDLNYDEDHLKDRLAITDATMNARAKNYDALMGLHNAALGEVDRRYKLEVALPGLMQEQAGEDLKIVNMRLAQAGQALGAIKDGVSGQVQVIQAQNTARTEMMSRLDAPTKTNLMTEAQKNDGTVMYNGVKLEYAELRDSLQTQERQDISTEAVKMSIQSNRMDMAQKFASDLARSLTRWQAQEAASNGGVFNGIQLDQTELTQVLQSHLTRDTIEAETLTNTMPDKLAADVAGTSIKQAAGLYSRATQLYGPNSMTTVTPILRQSSQEVYKLAELIRRRGDGENISPTAITAQARKAQETSALVGAAVDQVLIRASGGDKKSAAFAKSWVMGIKLDASASADAVTHYALKGNLPDGAMASPEAKKIFQAAQASVQRNRVDEKGKPRSNAALAQLVRNDLAKTSEQTIGAKRLEYLWPRLPEVAKAAKHPFGNLDESSWVNLNGQAAAQANKQASETLGISLERVTLMARTGKALGSTPQDKLDFEKFGGFAGRYDAIESQQIQLGLNDLPRVDSSMSNAETYVDFLRSNQLYEIARKYTENRGANSMGDYLINPMGEGALESQFAKAAGTASDAFHAADASRVANARAISSAYGQNIKVRVSTTLRGIDGVGLEGEKALRPHFNKFIEENQLRSALPSSKVQLPVAGREGNSTVRGEEALVKDFFTRTKFQDPVLESYRKSAIKGWDATSTAQESTFETVLSVLGTAMGMGD